MRILFLSDNFPPETNAPATRTFEHARVWVEAGHEVTVVTSAPNYPAGKLFPGYRNHLYKKETMAGITVIRVWTYMAPNAGAVKRILDFLSFMFSAIPAALRQPRPDLVVGTSPQLFTAVAAWVVAGLRRRPWIFELRDLWPASIIAVGAMKKSPLIIALERLAQFLYRKADAIVPVTNSFKSTLVDAGIDGDKIFVVRNGVELANFTPREADEAVRAEMGATPGEIVASYIGTLGMAHGLDTILEAARISKGEGIHYVLIGGGAERERLERVVREEGIDNLSILPSCARSRIPEFLAASDACIVHLRRSPVFKTVIPSKIFEAMAMARPIVLGVEGEVAEIIAAAGAGICIEPENANEMVQALRRIGREEGLGERLGNAGRQAVLAEFDRRVAAKRLLGFMERVAAKEPLGREAETAAR